MTFMPGQVANPTGKNGNLKGYQKYGDRAKQLLERYTTEEILDIVGSKAKFGKLPIKDAMIIMQLASTIAGEDRRLERESLLDRVEGKVAQNLDLSGQIGIVQIVLQATQQLDVPTLEHEPNQPIVLEGDTTSSAEPQPVETKD